MHRGTILGKIIVSFYLPPNALCIVERTSTHFNAYEDMWHHLPQRLFEVRNDLLQLKYISNCSSIIAIEIVIHQFLLSAAVA